MGGAVVAVLVYAVLLSRLQRQSSATTGAMFGVLFWLAGPMLLIPALFNLLNVANPGDFMLSIGWGMGPALIELGAHVIHGLIAGALCNHHVDPRSLRRS